MSVDSDGLLHAASLTLKQAPSAKSVLKPDLDCLKIETSNHLEFPESRQPAQFVCC